MRSKASAWSSRPKAWMASTKALLLFGAGKFHTQSSSLLHSKGSCKCSIARSSLSPSPSTVVCSSLWSLSCRDILLVFSVLLSPIQLTQWSPFWIRESLTNQLVNKSKKYMPTLASQVSGRVLVQEFSWSVPLPASNGWFTIPSRLPAVLPPPVVSEDLVLNFWQPDGV